MIDGMHELENEVDE